MLKHALKFARIKILTTCSFMLFLGSLSVGGITVKTFVALAVLVAWYIHAASSNDYADRKIDAVNLKGSRDRPLVTHSITIKKLWSIHFSAGAVALLLSGIYGVPGVLLTATILALNYAYSFKPFRITDRGALSQLMLPLAYAYYPFSLGYLSVQTDAPYPWLLAAGLYLGFVARVFLKDFRDVKGDSKFGKRTFLLRHGTMATCVVSELFGLSSLIVLSMAVDFSVGVVSVLLLGHCAALLFLLKLTKTSQVKLQLGLIAQLAKVANISVVTVLLYFFGNVYFPATLISLLLPGFVGLSLLLLTWKAYSYGVQTQPA